MDYKKHYYLLIERGQKRTKPECYVERHHIVPKCRGGNDDDGNLVYLTAEEHFVAHQLLCKIYPDDRKLDFALKAFNMNGKGRHLTNKSFGWTRRRGARAIKEANTGKVRSQEFKDNLAERNRGNILSEETKQKIGNANRGREPANKGKPRTDETKQKISKAKYKHKFLTPKGLFEDIDKAAKENECNKNTVRRRCDYDGEEWAEWKKIKI